MEASGSLRRIEGEVVNCWMSTQTGAGVAVAKYWYHRSYAGVEVHLLPPTSAVQPLHAGASEAQSGQRALR